MLMKIIIGLVAFYAGMVTAATFVAAKRSGTEHNRSTRRPDKSRSIGHAFNKDGTCEGCGTRRVCPSNAALTAAITTLKEESRS